MADYNSTVATSGALLDALLSKANTSLQPSDVVKQTSATDRTAGRVALVDHLPALIVPAQLGSELLTNPAFTTNLAGWSGANWAWASGSLATHTTGSTAALTQSVSVTAGTTYQIEVTITGRTAGSVTISLGSVALVDTGTTTTWSANATIQRTLVASGSGSQAFSVTPTSDFNGSISACSVKALTAPAVGAAVLDATGATAIELRGNASLSNVMCGIDAGRSNTTGANNSFFGQSAGYSNTTGLNNSFFGINAGYSNTTGASNSFFGVDAGYSNTTGLNNSFFGITAGRSNTTGANNSFFGRSAGRYQADGATALATAANSVYIGANSRGFSDADSNSIVIGASAIGRGANTTTLGTSETTNTAIYGDFESLSTAGGIILKSPGGTRYKLTVANGGTLSIAAA